jgi:hypothetical protein
MSRFSGVLNIQKAAGWGVVEGEPHAAIGRQIGAEHQAQPLLLRGASHFQLKAPTGKGYFCFHGQVLGLSFGGGSVGNSCRPLGFQG